MRERFVSFYDDNAYSNRWKTKWNHCRAYRQQSLGFQSLQGSRIRLWFREPSLSTVWSGKAWAKPSAFLGIYVSSSKILGFSIHCTIMHRRPWFMVWPDGPFRDGRSVQRLRFDFLSDRKEPVQAMQASASTRPNFSADCTLQLFETTVSKLWRTDGTKKPRARQAQLSIAQNKQKHRVGSQSNLNPYQHRQARGHSAAGNRCSSLALKASPNLTHFSERGLAGKHLLRRPQSHSSFLTSKTDHAGSELDDPDTGPGFGALYEAAILCRRAALICSLRTH